jgi:hypothetical protein
MSHNPYAPPGAKVEPAQIEAPVPDLVLTRIRGAWIAGLCSAGMTLAVTLIAISGVSMLGKE